jgi:hypothetical protein
MPEVEKAVKSYISLVCSNLRSRFDGKAMQFLKTYSLFRPSDESENQEMYTKVITRTLLKTS